jgi:hypothetical protein
VFLACIVSSDLSRELFVSRHRVINDQGAVYFCYFFIHQRRRRLTIRVFYMRDIGDTSLSPMISLQGDVKKTMSPFTLNPHLLLRIVT